MNVVGVCSEAEATWGDVGHEVVEAVIAKPSSQPPQASVDALRGGGVGAGGSSAGELVARSGCSFATHDPAAVVEVTHGRRRACATRAGSSATSIRA